jgi:hypothetical protein
MSDIRMVEETLGIYKKEVEYCENRIDALLESIDILERNQ